MNDDKDNEPLTGQIIPFENPWDSDPIFDWETCVRIKEVARYCRKSVTKLAIFGSRELNEEEQKEFSKYYAEGSAEGEMAISLKLFSSALTGDSKAVKEYLEQKAGWSGDGNDDDDDETGLHIYLTDI